MRLTIIMLLGFALSCCSGDQKNEKIVVQNSADSTSKMKHEEESKPDAAEKEEMPDPVFLGSQQLDAKAIGPNTIETWKLKDYYFIRETPGIARPNPFYTLKYKNTVIPNSKIIKNKILISLIEEKFKNKFAENKKSYPECYDNYYFPGIDRLSLYIDKENLLLSYTWKDNWNDIMENKSKCEITFSKTEIQIKLADALPLMDLK